MSVLIITRSHDNDSVEHVRAALRQRGHDSFRLDTDNYPLDVRLSTRYASHGQRTILHTAAGELDLENVQAVYYRRWAAGATLPREQLGDTWHACMQESSLTLSGTIATLPCFHLDPIASIRDADFKEWQYARAISVGLDCPQTLFSNDPDEVRAFAASLPGGMVAKMQSKVSVHRDGESQSVFTNAVAADHLERLDDLRYCPMMFQEMIEKALELRITVAGNEVLAASIDPSGSTEGRVDWRRDDALSYGWKPYELPAAVRDKLLRLVASFGLNYSAADFILTPDGRHIFLEINAAGEWFWLAREPGLPIAAAIAEVLTDASKRLTRLEL